MSETGSHDSEYQSVNNDEIYFNESVPFCDLTEGRCNIY